MNRRSFLASVAAFTAGLAAPRIAEATVFDYQLLGGMVDPGQAWWNNTGTNAFVEVGSGLSTPWRVSFTPTTPGWYIVDARLKHRMGGGSHYGRLYAKARIVEVAPNYKNDFALYQEAMWETNSGDLVRFYDAPLPPMVGVYVTAQEVNVQRTFAVEYLAGDGLLGQVGYGSPLVVFG